MQKLANKCTKLYDYYLSDGSYMFRQNNAIIREQVGSFLSYFNISMVGGKSWNILCRPMYCVL
jgi:hypothetical protein